MVGGFGKLLPTGLLEFFESDTVNANAEFYRNYYDMSEVFSSDKQPLSSMFSSFWQQSRFTSTTCNNKKSCSIADKSSKSKKNTDDLSSKACTGTNVLELHYLPSLMRERWQQSPSGLSTHEVVLKGRVTILLYPPNRNNNHNNNKKSDDNNNNNNNDDNFSNDNNNNYTTSRWTPPGAIQTGWLWVQRTLPLLHASHRPALVAELGPGDSIMIPSSWWRLTLTSSEEDVLMVSHAFCLSPWQSPHQCLTAARKSMRSLQEQSWLPGVVRHIQSCHPGELFGFFVCFVLFVLFVCLLVCLLVCLFVCLFVCLLFGVDCCLVLIVVDCFVDCC